MPHKLTRYERGGIIAFIILSLCVVFALYKNHDSNNKLEQVTVTNENNRYFNCIVSNNAIDQLNLQSGVQKKFLTIAKQAAIEKANSGDKLAAARAIEYSKLNKQLHDSTKLECIKITN